MPSKRKAQSRLSAVQDIPTRRMDLGGGGKETEQGLAKLTLTIVEVIRQTLERQALRRVESGTLTEEEVERMGRAFMSLKEKMAEMSRSFGMKPEELTGQLGALLKTGDKGLDSLSLVDVLDRLLADGVVIAGQLRIAVSNVDLVGLDLFALLYPVFGDRPWLDDGPVKRHA